MAASDKSLLMNHTCLRVKDPKVSVPFYEKHFGMTLINHFIMDGFTLYMMGYKSATPKNWSARPGVLELCHNHGAENDATYKLNNGNGDKFRGFGHTCITVDNIEACEKQLLADGVQFKKKLSDGRQQNIAFVLDPDGYWIELVEHKNNHQAGATDKATYRFNHTMVRVKDPEKSLHFYREVLGMKLFSRKDFESAQFSLYFLGYDHDPSFKEGELGYLDQLGREGVVELTHNWGTENDDAFEGYHNGNSTENGALQGYGHICVSSATPGQFCKDIENKFGDSLNWSVKWNQGKMKDLAFIRDPDGYSIEIIGHDIFHDWVDGRPPQ
ncbi:glyoxalase I [Metschnikowia bicuspidata var. bicuspidata NRRL YB-4993]|uniref:lactoylglutathione lyase n=1 Tax=Metschnikowia bicuspidata var. bicuspidata NRRL YB-4993 TaxID=869754 RepID=A0A1A0H5I2_9ASCO|nr:glyoxalase I [Metschnikowia bicuspidata var. bicuspidata NRRL YB-4993]OBA19162.1 glyoxalase I [Metschnikowia bicuspidata var. bicuspidata NRRL YB-4993]